MAQNLNTVKFIVATSTMHAVLIIMNCMKTILGHMFCLLGTLQNLRIQCEHVGYPHVAPVSPQQLYKGLKCTTKQYLVQE